MQGVSAKMIQDTLVLGFVLRTRMEEGRWTLRQELEQHFNIFPEKVVLAKANKLIDRKLLTGCGCGCYGGFELTDKGKELLRENG